MTVWSAVEPLLIDFDVLILPGRPHVAFDPNPLESHPFHPLTQAQFDARLRILMESEEASLTHAARELGVAVTTVRNRCRTLKLGPYRDLTPGAVRSMSSQPPFGWDLVQGELRRNQDEWQWVTEIHRMRLDGRSLRQIAAYLHSKKVATKSGGQWHTKTVSQILKFNAPYFDRASST